jgi:predicted kinase
MRELFLLRGLPGSGKSTLAKTIEPIFYFEADKYFEDEDGNYNFDVTKIKTAHEWCRSRVETVMRGYNGYPPNKIVVSNTFTQEWEMKPYFELAETYGYRVYSLIVENRHGGTNKHGVPEEKLVQMKNRFEIKL